MWLIKAHTSQEVPTYISESCSRGQFDEIYSELSNKILDLKPNEFKELKETYLNLETGTIRKQKELCLIKRNI